MMIVIPGKIPIRIFPFFWILILMIGWLSSESILGTLIWAIVITFSVLIHEYGHALTALAFGQQAEIDLVGLGGLTRRTGARIKLWQEFFVVLNGPFAGFLLFVIAYHMQPLIREDHFKLVAYALEVAIYVNLFWNILNLLPVQPLDGGHLLRIILESFLGFRGKKVAFFISIILAALLSLFFFILQSLLAGALFLMMAFESYRAWSEIKSVTSQDTDADLQAILKEAIEELKAGQQNEALSKFLFLRDQAKEGVLFMVSTQYIARILADQGQFRQAYDWLLPLEKRLPSDYLRLLQQLAYRLQEWNQAVRIGSRAYQEQPLAETALLNALAYSIMGQAKQAVGWLRSAVHLGLRGNIEEVIHRREFDAIRNSSEFQSFLNDKFK